MWCRIVLLTQPSASPPPSYPFALFFALFFPFLCSFHAVNDTTFVLNFNRKKFSAYRLFFYFFTSFFRLRIPFSGIGSVPKKEICTKFLFLIFEVFCQKLTFQNRENDGWYAADKNVLIYFHFFFLPFFLLSFFLFSSSLRSKSINLFEKLVWKQFMLNFIFGYD